MSDNTYIRENDTQYVPGGDIYSPAAEKLLYPLEERDLRYILPVAAACAVMVFCGFSGGMRLGFTVAYIVSLAVCTMYLAKDAAKPDGYTLLCGAVCASLSAVFSFSTSELNLIVITMLFGMSLVYFTGLASKRREDTDLSVITSCVAEFFLGAFGGIGRMFSSIAKTKPSMNPQRLRSLKGIALSLPLAAVLIGLLISSDAAFEGLVLSFSVDIGEDAFRLLFSLVLTVLVVSYCWSLRMNEPARSFGTRRQADSTVMRSFLWVICGVYIVYLFSQLAYFFSAFSGILPEGYTGEYMVSDYARRGFFEMCWIAVINFIVVFRCAALFGKERMRGVCLGQCLFICAFTMVIAFTALSKMALYIDMLGMTFLRVVTSVFMVCLMMVFVLLGVRLVKPSVRVVRSALIIFSCALLVMSFGDVNGFIASYDYSRYADGSLPDIDVWHLYSLGDSGVEHLIKLYASPDPAVKAQAADCLRSCCYRYWEVTYDSRLGIVPGDELYSGWSGWCLSSQRAMDLLEGFYKMHPEVLSGTAAGEWGRQ